MLKFGRFKSIKRRTGVSKNARKLRETSQKLLLDFKPSFFVYQRQLSATLTMEAAKKDIYVELIQMTGKVKFIKKLLSTVARCNCILR